MVMPATIKPGEDNDDLDFLYGHVIGQWRTELNHVPNIVGGSTSQEKYGGQPGPRFTPVPKARQVAAVKFLNENAFTTPTYFLDREVLRRIEPSGFVNRIRVRQTALLAALFQDARLSRLAEQAATEPPGNAYTLADLFADVRRGVFSELAAGRAIDPYRRQLQQAFVDQMERLITTPLMTPVPPQFAAFPGFTPSIRPTDARALARLELQGLQNALRAAGARTGGDRTTRAHVLDLAARIDRILNPR